MQYEPSRQPVEQDVSLVRRLVDRGEYLQAYDSLARLEKGMDPIGIQLEKLHSTVLSRLGMPEEAVALTEKLREATTGKDWELEALTGSYHKKLWLARRERDGKAALHHLERSHRCYSRARRLGGDYWCAINGATLARILGDDSAAVEQAGVVLEECWQAYRRNLTSSSFWIPATMGEACLVMEDYDSSVKWYKAARSHVGGNLGWLRSARMNAALLLETTKPDPGTAVRVRDALPRMRIALFAGHRLDRKGRVCTRFPESISERVRLKLLRELGRLNPDIGIASAADGADILFHESMRDMGKRTSVILPYREESFRKTLQNTVGEHWVKRFDGVLERADRVESACTGRFESCREFVHGFCSDYMLVTALDTAAVNDAELIPIVLWDGRNEKKPGGTADTVGKLRRLGLAPKWIRLPEMGEGVGCSTGAKRDEDETVFPSPPAVKPIVVVFDHSQSRCEEESINRIDRLVQRVRELYDPGGYPFLKSAVFPEGFSLVFGDHEEAWAFASGFMRNRDESDSFSMVLHAGVLVNLKNSISGTRDCHCRAVDEALAVCRTLRSPTTLCTMQARALSGPGAAGEERFLYQGVFRLNDGVSLQLFRFG